MTRAEAIDKRDAAEALAAVQAVQARTAAGETSRYAGMSRDEIAAITRVPDLGNTDYTSA